MRINTKNALDELQVQLLAADVRVVFGARSDQAPRETCCESEAPNQRSPIKSNRSNEANSHLAGMWRPGPDERSFSRPQVAAAGAQLCSLRRERA